MMMFGRKHDEPAQTTNLYQIQQRMMSVGDDFWIENGVGQKMFYVDGKALRIRDTLLLKDAAGNELLKIQSRMIRIRDTMVIERDDATVATGVSILSGEDDVLLLAIAICVDSISHEGR